MHAVTTQTTHNAAQTELVEAPGVEFAYRRFGRPSDLRLVMLQHFRGNLDNWDPALTDALAPEREVILVDYPRQPWITLGRRNRRKTRGRERLSERRPHGSTNRTKLRACSRRLGPWASRPQTVRADPRRPI
jgi:hypothetical protein